MSFQSFLWFFLTPFTFGFHISTSLELYIGYVDGANRSSWRLFSTTWDVFAQNGKLASMQGICIGFSTNDIVEYSAMVELLFDVIWHDLRCLFIRFDSQLVVLQLANVYYVRNLTILCMVLRVCLP